MYLSPVLIQDEYHIVAHFCACADYLSDVRYRKLFITCRIQQERTDSVCRGVARIFSDGRTFFEVQ